MTKFGQMNYDCQEPKMGEGLVPLFAAATIFWMTLVGLGVWLLK